MYLTSDLEEGKGYENVPKAVNVFFIVLGKQILDGYEKFVDNIVTVIEDTTNQDLWKTYLLSNLGFNYFANENKIVKRQTGLYQDFERSKTESTKLFQKFKDEVLTSLLPNNIYKPFNGQKKRIMDYEKQNPAQQQNEQNLRNVWSQIDIPSEYFNLKKTLN
jgi:hypothetical protein